MSNGISRRGFIGRCGMILGGLMVFPGTVFARIAYPEFVPDLYCGEWMRLDGAWPGLPREGFGGVWQATNTDINTPALREPYKFLQHRIKRLVPPEYRDDRFIDFLYRPMGSAGTVDPLLQHATLGWKYKPRHYRHEGHHLMCCRWPKGREKFVERLPDGTQREISEEEFERLDRTIQQFAFKRELPMFCIS